MPSKNHNALSGLLALLLASAARAGPGGEAEHDIVVYGGTSAGVVAAVQAARMGRSVVLIEPGRHLGGLSSGGLGKTDTGDQRVIGGAARELYRRLKRHYDRDEAWVHEKKSDYPGYEAEADAIWGFEPQVAERVFEEMLREARVTVVKGERLLLGRPPGEDGGGAAAGVLQDGAAIRAIVMESGRRFPGKVFIDATYEGDLMAMARVRYAVGREPNALYGETLNGVQKARARAHQLADGVDPWVEPGNPASGLLPGVHGEDPGEDGAGDRRLQAYCFRLTMTDVPSNRVPFAKPEGYDEKRYELLLRNFEAGETRVPLSVGMMPNRKTDANNNYGFSTDNIGMSYDYPDGDYATRARITREHELYQKGLLWTLANHPRVPAAVRREVSRWGLARDEFTDNGNWPHQLYIREARRMIGAYVMTEHDCRRLRIAEDPAGMGSYNMDSHHCQRYVTKDGRARNEGDIQVSPGGAYTISYRALLPRAEECANLLVPVCLSSSHIAYGSIRMEPVFMVLGQTAATAASLALADGVRLAALDYAKLRARLLADGQVLELPSPAPPRPPGIDPRKLAGVVIDDEDARWSGDWIASTSVGPFVGEGYRHDGHAAETPMSARFEARLPRNGRWEVRLAYSSHSNRAASLTVTVHHAGGATERTVDQRRPPPLDGAFVSLGTFSFEARRPAAVVLSNQGAGGHAIADAVQFLPLEAP